MPEEIARYAAEVIENADCDEDHCHIATSRVGDGIEYGWAKHQSTKPIAPSPLGRSAPRRTEGRFDAR
jgi:hypothetical protein